MRSTDSSIRICRGTLAFMWLYQGIVPPSPQYVCSSSERNHKVQ
jgi:hypothetical protein